MTLKPENGIAGALHGVIKIALIPAGQDERVIIVGLEHVEALRIRKRHFEGLGRSLHAYFALEVDGLLVFTSLEQENSTNWKFPEIYKFPAHPSSRLRFKICRNSRVQGSQVLAEFEAPLLTYLHGGKAVPFAMESEDSPESAIIVALSVNADWQPIPNMLCYAKDLIGTVERDHSTLSLVSDVLKGLQTLCNAVQEVAKVTAIAHVAYLFLFTLYRAVEKHVELDNEIKALVQLMKDVLVDIEKYLAAHGKGEEKYVFNIIQTLAEGAGLIDEWNHVPKFNKPAMAPKLILELKTCESKLTDLRAKYTASKRNNLTE